MFGNNSLQKIKKNPLHYLQAHKFDDIHDEKIFRAVFFETLHVIKAKRSLQDYRDLNRRYMKNDGKFTLDTIPRHYFATITDKLLDSAFYESYSLKNHCSLEQIANFLQPDKTAILAGINREFSLHLKLMPTLYTNTKRQQFSLKLR